MPAKEKYKIEDAIALYRQYNGVLEPVAAKLNVDPSGLRRRLIGAGVHKPKSGVTTEVDEAEVLSGGTQRGRSTKRKPLPKEGEVKRYIVTSCQNNTKIHKKFWNNILEFAKLAKAEILVSRFSYNKSRWGSKSVKPGTEPTRDDVGDLWYAPEITDYICDDRVQLAPDLIFCGESNILPTVKNPLQGKQSYCGDKSTIFGHTQISMESVANLGRTKFMYSTGSCSQMNYVQKNAGIQAEFDHVFGFLIVEVDDKKNWWVRQVSAKSDGSFSDIMSGKPITIKDGKAEPCSVDVCSWGDIHVAQGNPNVIHNIFGKGGVIDKLKPKYQMMHDIFDSFARNPHNRNNPHEQFARFVNRQDSVADELTEVGAFLEIANRKFCQTVVVNSNHDFMLERWLASEDYRYDAVNAVCFLTLQKAMYEAIARKDDKFQLFEYAVKYYGKEFKGVDKVKFLAQDKSFKVNDIELSLHGHQGPNGARGNSRNLANLGTKATIGHSHSANITRGVYTAGVFGKLKMGYNKGPSSWSHSFVLQFGSGKRQVITRRNGKWWA